jgi:uncharacterized protein YlxW (UPF0749 family)
MTAPAVLRPGRSRIRTWAGGPFLVLLVTALVGFLLVSQLRGTERLQQRLEDESEADLTRILASLTTEADDLQDEIASLRLQLLTLQTSSARDETAAQAAEQQLRSLEVLAGSVAVTGPGVTVVVEDPRRSVRYDSLIDIVQELRDAGAEAIQVGSARVVASTAFLDAPGGGVTVDGRRVRAPYTVLAIGDSQTMATALEIPGGVIASLPEGARGSVAAKDEVKITALHAVRTPRYARPAATATPSR